MNFFLIKLENKIFHFYFFPFTVLIQENVIFSNYEKIEVFDISVDYSPRNSCQCFNHRKKKKSFSIAKNLKIWQLTKRKQRNWQRSGAHAQNTALLINGIDLRSRRTRLIQFRSFCINAGVILSF